MPLLFIHTKNSQFQARDSGAECQRPDDAMASGVSSAVALAADEIAQGRGNAAIEIIIERDDGQPVLRSVVAISASPLSTTESTVIAFPHRE